MTQIAGSTTRILLALFGLFLFLITVDHYSVEASESKTTFTVQWYDVGQDALEGLNGVKKVEKGFRGSKEINTVYFDPEAITIEEMEAALKAAGTYVGTADE